MFAYIKGPLVEVTPLSVVVDVGGIGYKIFISIATWGKLPSMGDLVTLYTTFVVREDFQGLYGFLTTEERALFELLIGLSGVGPKLALSLLGHLTVADLHGAVAKADIRALSAVPGVGKKTAERLIIEMKDKCLPSSIKGSHVESHNKNPEMFDAISALTNLGYSQQKARDAVEEIAASSKVKKTLAELIREALQLISL